MKHATQTVYIWPDDFSLSRAVYRTVDFSNAAYTTLKLWRSRSRQRRRLTHFSDHQLKDIGVSRADAWAESSKPFWKA